MLIIFTIILPYFTHEIHHKMITQRGYTLTSDSRPSGSSTRKASRRSPRQRPRNGSCAHAAWGGKRRWPTGGDGTVGVGLGEDF